MSKATDPKEKRTRFRNKYFIWARGENAFRVQVPNPGPGEPRILNICVPYSPDSTNTLLNLPSWDESGVSEQENTNMCRTGGSPEPAFGTCFLESTHLVFAITGEDANPLVIIVSNDNVTIWMHSDTSGPLQLPRRTATDSKPALKLSLIGEDLDNQLEYN